MERKEPVIKEDIQITYYFTAVFMAIGIALVFYILYQKVGKVNLFIILLSVSAGGLPVGVIGAFIDYKFSERRFGKRSFE
ncbi:hypothetical protein [Sporosarcina sp. G11-34]|uniref:hypothetical protein n=1 Tax=Sporosarcina sp. G11-34 TaxID=2849605 RepID=UPI0022A9B9B8|nr:hypothetical protein [Sporosarcina sp. G11-34]MCZ2258270.1 hypothetical protein [Sporosarcina sp. G11-34]